MDNKRDLGITRDNNGTRRVPTLSLWSEIWLQTTVGQNYTLRSPAARILRLYHPRGHITYTSKIKHLIREYKILQRLWYIEPPPPSQVAITEYENIHFLLMKVRSLANSKVRQLNMSGVQSLRAVKLAQLRLKLTNILIKKKEDNSKIKLNTVCKLAKITGQHWWITLDWSALIWKR